MISVVLVRPETSNNVGFISRVMANFDVENLILIDPICDHLDDEALKISMHSKPILNGAYVKPYSYFKNIKSDFDLVVGTTSVLGSDYNIPRTPLTPREFFEKTDTNQNIALIFGNEGKGLSNDEIKKCDILISIPTSRKYAAMNISHAVSVVLYEYYMIAGLQKINSHIKKATASERTVILDKIDFIIDNLDFTTQDKRNTQRKAWKNIIEKSMMSKREAFAIIGLLKKLEDKFSKS